MNPFAVARATFELGLRLAALPFEIGARMLGVGSDDERSETRAARTTSSPARSRASSQRRGRASASTRDSGQASGTSTRSSQQRRRSQTEATKRTTPGDGEHTTQRRTSPASSGRTAKRPSNGAASSHGRPAATPSSEGDEGAKQGAAPSVRTEQRHRATSSDGESKPAATPSSVRDEGAERGAAAAAAQRDRTAVSGRTDTPVAKPELATPSDTADVGAHVEPAPQNWAPTPTDPASPEPTALGDAAIAAALGAATGAQEGVQGGSRGPSATETPAAEVRESPEAPSERSRSDQSATGNERSGSVERASDPSKGLDGQSSPTPDGGEAAPASEQSGAEERRASAEEAVRSEPPNSSPAGSPRTS